MNTITHKACHIYQDLDSGGTNIIVNFIILVLILGFINSRYMMKFKASGLFSTIPYTQRLL